VVYLVIYDSGWVTLRVEESKGFRHLLVLCPSPEVYHVLKIAQAGARFWPRTAYLFRVRSTAVASDLRVSNRFIHRGGHLKGLVQICVVWMDSSLIPSQSWGKSWAQNPRSHPSVRVGGRMETRRIPLPTIFKHMILYKKAA
jgi:hypothetical protein